MRLGDLSSWDLDKATWGGQESWGEETGVLVGESAFVIDKVGEAAGKSSELGSNKSRKVDVSGVVNYEENKRGDAIKLGGVVDNNINLQNLVKAGKEEDRIKEISSKDLSNMCGNKVCGLEENLSSDVGMEVDWVVLVLSRR
nr:hypothetical protein [Tanacetum cinerariifolium]